MVYAFSFMVAFALSTAMFSTILPKLISDYSLSLAQAGLFPVFSGFGTLTTMLLIGLIGDRFSKRISTGIAFAAMGVFLLCIGSLPPFLLLLVVFTMLSASSSAFNLLITAYLSDVYGAERSRYINLLHVFFGLGSMAGPLYPILLNSLGLHWNASYLILSAVILIGSASYFLLFAKNPPTQPITDKGKDDDTDKEKDKSEVPATQVFTYRKLLTSPSMIAMCVFSFLYLGGHQMAFSTWFQTYLQWNDPLIYTPAFTSICMTLYWIGMVASRMLCAILSKRFSSRTFLLVGASVGSVVLILGFAISQPWSWVVVAALLGFCTGPIYPVSFALACEWFPKISARVSSFVGFFSSTGGMFFGWLLGSVADVSFRGAMMIPVVTLIIVFSIVLFFFPKTSLKQ